MTGLQSTRFSENDLSLALNLGKVNELRAMLDAGINPNTVVDGLPLLCNSAMSPFPEMTALLLLRGADVHAASNEGMQAIHYAARAAAHPDILTMLLEAGANPNAQDLNLEVPVGLAAEKGHLALARELLAAGAAIPQYMRQQTFWDDALEKAKDLPRRCESIEQVQRIVRSTLLSESLESGMSGEPESAPARSSWPSPL